MTYDAALERLSCAPITEPATIMEGEIEVPNPWIAHDSQERADAQAVIDGDGKWQGKLPRPVIDFIFWPVQKNHCAKASL